MSRILQEDEGELAEECKELMKELELDIEADKLEQFMEGVSQVEESVPAGHKIQHFLHAMIHSKRLKQWLGSEKGERCGEEEELEVRRERLRKMLVMRGDKETGYVGNWLNAVPCEALGTKMGRAVFLVALTWWLGGRMWQSDKCEARTVQGQKCGKELDQWGDHAVNCKVGPGVIARHNGINLAWMLAEKAAGYSVQREQRVQVGSRKKPADTLVWGWKGGDACAQDWAVVHPMTKAGLKEGRKLDPYEAVEKAEERKRRAEAGLCEDAGVEFVPLAMDTFGGFGPSAAEAMMVVADQMRTLKGEEEEEKDYRAKRLAQKLRIWMLKFLSRQILSRSDVGKMDELEEMEQVARILEQTEVTDVDHKKKERLGQTESETESETDEIECCTRDRQSKSPGGKKGPGTGVESRKGEAKAKRERMDRMVDFNETVESVPVKAIQTETEGGESDCCNIFSEEADNDQKWREKGDRSGRTRARNKRQKAKRPNFQRGGGRKGERSRSRGTKAQTRRKAGGVDLRKEWMESQGLLRWNVGQGRGGECQYLSVLATTDEKACHEVDGRIVWNYARVDELRRKVAAWLERNQDQCMAGGMSLRDMILEDHRGRGDENTRWNAYIRGVRDAARNQWGDEFTLVALSGVMGRPIITLTGRAGEVPRVEERTPPEGWEMSALTGAPLLLTHEMDHHYTPVRVQEGSFWGWIPAWESAVREGSGHTEGLKQRSADAWERKDRNGCGRRVDRTRRGRDERRAWSVCSDVSADLAVQGCNDSLSLRPAALVNGGSATVDLAVQSCNYPPSLQPAALGNGVGNGA